MSKSRPANMDKAQPSKSGAPKTKMGIVAKVAGGRIESIKGHKHRIPKADK